MEEIAKQVSVEHLKTGRDIREILDAMRDDGYIDCDDLHMEEMAEMASIFSSTPKDRWN